MGKRRNCSSGAISPFPTIFLLSISNGRSQITYSFVNYGCAICIFLNSENLICRSTDISKGFRWSHQLRDNESRLYVSSSAAYKFDYQWPRISHFLQHFRRQEEYQYKCPAHSHGTNSAIFEYSEIGANIFPRSL